MSRSVDTLSFLRGDLPSADIVSTSDGNVAEVREVSLHCFCQKPGGEPAGSEVSGPCGSGETRSCSELVKLGALAPGDATLRFTDTEGRTNTVLVVVREAAAMRLEARLGERLENGLSFGNGTPPLEPAADGAIEVPVGALVVVRMHLYDRGDTLRFEWTEGFEARVAEGTSLAAEDCGHGCGPNGGLAVFEALQAGESRVVFEGRGLSSEVRVRVK